MTDLEKDKILLLAHSIEKMARELQSIKRLLKEMADASQTETKTETQNSNLTFEKRTMRDCYNCRRYETEGECIECKFEPKDECAKEYEELGLKELKELIEADRKDENSSEKPNNCDTCKHNKLEWFSEVCDGCSKAHSNYEPQTERSE